MADATCTAPGCEKPRKNRGGSLCSMHAARVARHGSLDGKAKRRPLIDRILDRVVQNPDGCWGWTGTTDNYGYAVLRHPAGNTKAHRAIYAHLVGPIPAGAYIDHACHNKTCNNPAHLRLATPGQNQENWDHVRKDSLTGVRGVTFHRASGLYMARVSQGGRRVFVKYFKTKEEAGAAAAEARIKYHTHNDKDRVGSN